MTTQISGPLFQEYIGEKTTGNAQFKDVPNNKQVTLQFVLSFARDYDATGAPTNGDFKPYWKPSFTPDSVQEIKHQYSNVKVLLGVGGRDTNFPFTTSDKDSWVKTAAFSLGNFIDQYSFDGIEVNYEYISPASAPDFAYCVGELIKLLKERKVIDFASIAPSSKFQSNYTDLYTNYKQHIDLVSYQFYTHSLKSPKEFIDLYFDIHNNKFAAAKLLAGLSTDPQDAENLPADIFFRGCQQLKAQGNFSVGIFIWNAEDSYPSFQQEIKAQDLLASP